MIAGGRHEARHTAAQCSSGRPARSECDRAGVFGTVERARRQPDAVRATLSAPTVVCALCCCRLATPPFPSLTCCDQLTHNTQVIVFPCESCARWVANGDQVPRECVVCLEHLLLRCNCPVAHHAYYQSNPDDGCYSLVHPVVRVDTLWPKSATPTNWWWCTAHHRHQRPRKTAADKALSPLAMAVRLSSFPLTAANRYRGPLGDGPLQALTASSLACVYSAL